MIRRPPRSTQSRSSAASDVYKRQALTAIYAVSTTIDDRRGLRCEVDGVAVWALPYLPLPAPTRLPLGAALRGALATLICPPELDVGAAVTPPDQDKRREQAERRDRRPAEEGGLESLGEGAVSYTHLRAHETKANIVCRLLL